MDFQIEDFPALHPGADVVNPLMMYCRKDPERLLDLIDFQLRRPRLFRLRSIDSLSKILDRGRSVFRVVEIGDDVYQLHEHPSEESLSAFEMALESDCPDSVHLREAWQAAFSREPNPSHAYSEAIKAVESALKPLVSPNNHAATLGTMIGDLRGRAENAPIGVRLNPDPPKGEGEDPVEVVRRLANVLWQSQKVRHGGGDLLQNSLEEARDAVMIAVMVVNLCQAGGIYRTDRI